MSLESLRLDLSVISQGFHSMMVAASAAAAAASLAQIGLLNPNRLVVDGVYQGEIVRVWRKKNGGVQGILIPEDGDVPSIPFDLPQCWS